MAFWIFLVNRLFSQKNGNKAGISNQTGVNVSGGVKYKHSNLYYDENGVPWHSKAELAEVVKQDFITTNGWGKPDGSKQSDVINKNLSTIPSKQRNSAAWTLQRMAGDYATRMEKLVRENNPGWKPGDAFDTGILDQLDGTIGGVDFRA